MFVLPHFLASTIGWCTVVEYSQLERIVIQHIVSHISQNRELTLADIAEQCHVSKSTVIKALQKLGYRGFRDFHRDVRLGARSSNDALLPSRVTRRPVEDEAKALSDLLYRHKGDRNFIFKSDRRSGDLLANYLSRKLSLFGILCPATYDYSIVDIAMDRSPG
ncbi:winged helix-turn-helix transcriptional regulator, partial [Megamonas sp.]|uniref:MurR/RpiR family transcriptional regulator n=1 Tax=Megamonas sp. TaxID=2049033 RepID=UPI002588648F